MLMFKKIKESINALRDVIYLRKQSVAKKVKLDKYCIENKVKVYENVQLNNSELGEYSYVAENCIISNSVIGKFCSVGPNTIMGYGEHPTNLISTSPVFYNSNEIAYNSFATKNYVEDCKQIIIGNDVWIGAQVYIKNGITIGNGAVIAAGAIVTNDVPDYAIAGGVPAKVIKFRFDEETVTKLLKMQWWNWSEEKLKLSQSKFVSSDVKKMINELT